MKKIAFGVLATLIALMGLIPTLNTFYNIAGLVGIQDGASGSKTELVLTSLLFAFLAGVAFFASYRLFSLMNKTSSP